MRDDFSHIETWVFDLDNTLYPPQFRLFDQIEVKMTAWVMRELGVGATEANRLRQHYWDTYGTTLAGLMREHGADPAPYLTEVHDIDFSVLPADPPLARAIKALPGRRIQNFQGIVAGYEALDGPIALATAQALAGVLAYAVDGPDGDTDQRG